MSKSSIAVDTSHERKLTVQASALGRPFLTWGDPVSGSRFFTGVSMPLDRVTPGGTLEVELGGVKVSVDAADAGATLFLRVTGRVPGVEWRNRLPPNRSVGFLLHRPAAPGKWTA